MTESIQLGVHLNQACCGVQHCLERGLLLRFPQMSPVGEWENKMN